MGVVLIFKRPQNTRRDDENDNDQDAKTYALRQPGLQACAAMVRHNLPRRGSDAGDRGACAPITPADVEARPGHVFLHAGAACIGEEADVRYTNHARFSTLLTFAPGRRPPQRRPGREIDMIFDVLVKVDLQAKVTWLEYLLDLYQVPREVKLSDEAQREANNVPVAWG